MNISLKLPKTFSFYIVKSYLLNLLMVMGGLMALTYFFDVIELLRRAGKFDDVPIGLVLHMGLLKLPEVSQILFPFAILFSAIYTFWQLTQRLELIVVRSAGFSVWQFLVPVLLVAMTAGILQMSVFNPLGALFLGQYERLENVHLKRQRSEIAFFQDGLWLRQDAEDGYVILHMRDVRQPDWVFSGVTGLFFNEDNTFVRRADAKDARLEDGHWILRDVIVNGGGDGVEKQENLRFPTHLTVTDIEDSFSSPETIAFWSLPAHIRVLEASGFDATKLRVHYQSLLAQPLMLAAMVLIAAAVSMRPPRSGSAFYFVVVGIFVGLGLFFVSNFMQALGASQQVPVVVSAWAPAVLSFFFGLSVIVNQEEG